MTTCRVGASCLALLLAGCASSPSGQRVGLPGGHPGIGFDDLRYSAKLHRVLVPGGRTGALDLIDPDTLNVTSIAGFGAVAGYSGSHDDGPTSVDEGNGLLYVTDRTTGLLDVVDPAAARVVASVAPASGPDYVRYVQATNELWVTEPGADQVEIFALGKDPTVAPSHAAVVAVTNGPESMVIDNKRGRAYTHRWQTTTVAIDLASRAIVAEWPNGCAAARGIALDEDRGFLFASCSEGTTSVLDLNNGGRMLSTLARGSGFDVVGYSPKTGHLYLGIGRTLPRWRRLTPQLELEVGWEWLATRLSDSGVTSERSWNGPIASLGVFVSLKAAGPWSIGPTASVGAGIFSHYDLNTPAWRIGGATATAIHVWPTFGFRVGRRL